MNGPVHLWIAIVSAKLVLLGTCGPAATPVRGVTTAGPRSEAPARGDAGEAPGRSRKVFAGGNR
jgi:hypothetical protein